MKRNIICTVCPRGCLMEAVSGASITVTGNTCPRGEQYAVAECTNPVRSLTAVVRVSNREDTMVSVKSREPVPKGQMLAIMERLHEITVAAPVYMGEVILPDVFGTDMVATKEIL